MMCDEMKKSGQRKQQNGRVDECRGEYVKRAFISLFTEVSYFPAGVSRSFGKMGLFVSQSSIPPIANSVI